MKLGKLLDVMCIDFASKLQLSLWPQVEAPDPFMVSKDAPSSLNRDLIGKLDEFEVAPYWTGRKDIMNRSFKKCREKLCGPRGQSVSALIQLYQTESHTPADKGCDAGSTRVYAIGVPWSYSEMCFPTKPDTEAMEMRGQA